LGVELILIPDPIISSTTATEEIKLLQAQQVVARRLGKLRLAGSYNVVIQDDQLVARLPDSENMPYIASVVSSVGEIEFINGGDISPPVGRRVKTAAQANPERNIYQTLFTGQEVETAMLPDPAAGQIFYQLTLKPATVERLSSFVKTQAGYYVCMVMDEQVINCSMMHHWSGNTVEILPSLSSGVAISLADLAVFLDSGPLPMPLKVVTR
jgi:preprotein translocase subunit SecD